MWDESCKMSRQWIYLKWPATKEWNRERSEPKKKYRKKKYEYVCKQSNWLLLICFSTVSSTSSSIWSMTYTQTHKQKMFKLIKNEQLSSELEIYVYTLHTEAHEHTQASVDSLVNIDNSLFSIEEHCCCFHLCCWMVVGC